MALLPDCERVGSREALQHPHAHRRDACDDSDGTRRCERRFDYRNGRLDVTAQDQHSHGLHPPDAMDLYRQFLAGQDVKDVKRHRGRDLAVPVPGSTVVEAGISLAVAFFASGRLRSGLARILRIGLAHVRAGPGSSPQILVDREVSLCFTRIVVLQGFSKGGRGFRLGAVVDGRGIGSSRLSRLGRHIPRLGSIVVQAELLGGIRTNRIRFQVRCRRAPERSLM